MFDNLKANIKDMFENYLDIKISDMPGMYLAGGALTSVFSNQPINDFDLYFSSREALVRFWEKNAEDSACAVVCVTDKAITLKFSGYIVQLIHYKFYETAEDIFQSFDFTVNMVAYDFAQDKIIMHDNFLADLAAKRLCLEGETDFPIATLERVFKYKERGFSCASSQLRKISMMISKLDLSVKEDFFKHYGGMYSAESLINLVKVFGRKDFDHEEALNILESFKPTSVAPMYANTSVPTIIDALTANCPKGYIEVLIKQEEDYKRLSETPYTIATDGRGDEHICVFSHHTKYPVTYYEKDKHLEILYYRSVEHVYNLWEAKINATAVPVHLLFFPNMYRPLMIDALIDAVE